MNHPFSAKKLPYSWENVKEYWPQRLIHVPTMESIPRDDNNVYRAAGIDVHKPKYNILSYTWGRWKIPDGTDCPALPVTGTPWQIPAVKEEHFTVDAFQKVIRTITGTDIAWVWVDVGCIDQRDNEQAALEIGRQASIFKQAQSSFVWLSHVSTAKLTSAIQDAQTYGLEMRDYIDKRHASLDIMQIVTELKRALNNIFQDPWFSSLWTLQEVVLRNDAVMLSTEGEPVAWESEPRLQYAFLTMFINHCQNIYWDLEDVEKRVWAARYTGNGSVDEGLVDSLRDIREQILQAGFYYLFSDNPNVQYGTARYRKTSRRVDRVYAIMQIYDIRVGKSAPGDNPELEELVDEFASAILQLSPGHTHSTNSLILVLGGAGGWWDKKQQYRVECASNSAVKGGSCVLFIHVTPPEKGKTWRITENSTVPDILMNYREPNSLCTIIVNPKNRSGPVRASGMCCLLAGLMKISTEAGFREGLMADNGWGLRFEVLLDYHIKGAITGRRALYAPRLTDSRSLETNSESATIDHEKVRVLLLGDVRGTWNTRNRAFERRNLGLLLYSSAMGDDRDWKSAPYERLGICLWGAFEDWHDQMLEQIPWERVDGLELH
ncbi:heterokaryon incompatibility protein-domain-containing protein [Xylaria flabelliformis]|nr:heterokaryon incompatibility protein-domain-containing protein [Xylaria flabelliformis]